MGTAKRLSAVVAAGALVFAMAGTALAVTYATVTGHEAFSAEANAADYWGENCTKINTGEGGLGDNQQTFELGANYALVVVKSGAGAYANTLFENASAGESVWADTDGNSTFDGDEPDISHIIFCDEEETEESEEPSEEPSFEASEEAETDEPTEPPTNTVGRGTSGPADGAWLLVVALGVFLASVVVLTPARARNR